MATKSHVQGPDDGSGKKVDCVAVTRSGSPVYRQVVVVAESDDDDLILRHVAAGTLQAIPTGLTPLVAGTCKLDRLFVVNTTAGIPTITVQDGSGTPLKLLNAVEIAPGAAMVFDLGKVIMSGGVSWQASGAGLNGYAVAYQ